MFVSNLACWLYFYEHLSRWMLLKFVMYEHKRFKISPPLTVQLNSLWPVVFCSSQRIAFHHVSSWHKRGSRRPFLELRLQTVSLVGNLLTPVTSHVLFRYSELKKQENYTDSSHFLGFFFVINIFPNLFQLFLSSWSDFAQEDATITTRLWNCTSTHTYFTCSQPFFFTRFCLPVIPQDFACISSFCLSWFLIFCPWWRSTNRHRCIRPNGLFNVLKVKSRAWWLCVLPVPYPD